jgi:NAD+ synthase (glutamine-hydrolysing)
MRLALAQINPTVGDIAGNSRIIIDFLRRARDERADLVVFPELSLCGYPPKDLLLQEGFIKGCIDAARDIGEHHTQSVTAVLGLPTPADEDSLRAAHQGGRPERIANSLVVYRDGRYVEYYDKRLLPTYDVFDEDRYFTPGSRAAVLEIAGVPTGLSICEDLWRAVDAGLASRYQNDPDPLAELAAAGARLIVSPSASPFVLGKGERHRQILSSSAERCSAYLASVNQVGGNDDLIFDGHSAVYGPGGELLASAPGFREHLLVVDVPVLPGAAAVHDHRKAASAEQLLWDALVLGTRDYCRKTGFTGALLGISGGIDSALTAAIAAAALGPEHITGLIMPGRYSSEHSQADAVELARRLNIRCLTVPIDDTMSGFSGAVNGMFARLRLPVLGGISPDLAEENLQSRIRGTLLMAHSNRSGAIVLSTGNKSELAVGYCTLYGDMNGGLAVLSDVTKQQVYRIARWINQHHAERGFAQPPIPERSITKPPSAELRPDQTDQDTLPPYEILDAIIQRYVEQRQNPATIVRETGYDPAVVARITRMIDASEFKRRQAALGLKVSGVAFGGGRRYPIAQRWRPAPEQGQTHGPAH